MRRLYIFALGAVAITAKDFADIELGEAAMRLVRLETDDSERRASLETDDSERQASLETDDSERQASTGSSGSDRDRRVGRVSPKLHPASDAKFFDGHRADYATDGHGGVRDHFGYPFPEVQDSHDYDKDYVKDENADDGEWNAQQHYDKIRSQLVGVRAAADQARRAEMDQANKLKVKTAEEKRAEMETANQRRIADEARTDEARLQEKSAAADRTIAEAEKLVHSEVKDLEDCKKQ